MGRLTRGFRLVLRNAVEDLFRLPPIALERDEHGYLVPDVLEAATVIRQDLAQHLAVGYVNDPAGAPFGVDPVADLHEGELEDADVDDVARVLPDLDAVARLQSLEPDPADDQDADGNGDVERGLADTVAGG